MLIDSFACMCACMHLVRNHSAIEAFQNWDLKEPYVTSLYSNNTPDSTLCLLSPSSESSPPDCLSAQVHGKYAPLRISQSYSV